MTTTVAVAIPESEWRQLDDDPLQRHLIGPALVINGTSHHVEAFEVSVDASGTQQFSDREEDLDMIYDAIGGEGPWETVEIFGRDYVLIITPYCT